MLRGLDEVNRNLERWYHQGILKRCREAMEKICVILEGHAKKDHGDTPREARWVGKGKNRAFRPAGEGWGDITSSLNTGTEAFISHVTPLVIVATLSARPSYAVFIELAKDGKWAWLWPAIEDNLPEIRRILEGITK